MNLTEKLQEYMNSEEGKKALEKATQEIVRKTNAAKKIHDELSIKTAEEISSLLNRAILKHDERWKELCLKNGVQPYPWEIMNCLFSSAEHFGEDYTGESLDDFDKHFGAYTKKYLGYYFNWIFGQGTVLRIFDENKVEIFRM